MRTIKYILTLIAILVNLHANTGLVEVSTSELKQDSGSYIVSYPKTDKCIMSCPTVKDGYYTRFADFNLETGTGNISVDGLST